MRIIKKQAVRQCETDYKNLFFGPADHILLTEILSRLNITGFQPGLDKLSDVKSGSVKPKKEKVKAYGL